MRLNSAFLSQIFTFIRIRFNSTIIRLLLFSNIRPFTTIVRDPINISTMTTIMQNFTFTYHSIVTTSSNTSYAIQTISSTLTSIPTRKERRVHLNYLCIFLNALNTSTIPLCNSIVLRNMVSAVTGHPLFKYIFLHVRPNKRRGRTKRR